MNVQATVTIRPKAGLRDPEGSTIGEALHALGYTSVRGVHMGRQVTLELECASEGAAAELVDEMCQRILANPVIEDYTIQVAVLS